ncbi:MAG: VWA domain-containing protein [Acidobacteria bacterium]|nr:VWA domain-containing protein [Acidobacteriota bacterium]
MAKLILFLIITNIISAPVSAQDLPLAAAPEANAFLDVYFKHKETFVDDIRVDEIKVKNRKNIRAVAVKPINAIPLHTTILLDISGSQHEHANEMRRLYLEMINALPLQSVDAVRLIYFNDRIRDIRNITPSRSLLLKGLDNNRFMGDTKLYDAIYYACRTLTDNPESRKVMIILSDGSDAGSSKSIEEAYREAIANNIRVYMFMIINERVHYWFSLGMIDLGYGKQKKHIERTGGKVIMVSNSETAGEPFMQIMDEWSHLKRILLCVDTYGKPASGLKISVSRKGVKAYHPSTPQFIAGASSYNDSD